MTIRNKKFKEAVDWLYKNGKIGDQHELAEKTGISEVTISRILNDRVRQPSEDSLRRLNSSFNNIFNMQWLRGEDTVMLAIDVKPEKIDPLSLDKQQDLLLELRKENALLFVELKKSINDVKAMMAELDFELKKIKTYQSKKYEEAAPPYYQVAEQEDKV